METRMLFVRTFSDPGDITFPVTGEPCQTGEALEEDMGVEIISTLVQAATGEEKKGKTGNLYWDYPYGKPAATSREGFMKVPDSQFGLTLAELYPYIRRDISK